MDTSPQQLHQARVQPLICMNARWESKQWSAVDDIAEAHCAVLSSSERVGGANGMEWNGMELVWQRVWTVRLTGDAAPCEPA
jgi:hypothetical protein